MQVLHDRTDQAAVLIGILGKPRFQQDRTRQQRQAPRCHQYGIGRQRGTDQGRGHDGETDPAEQRERDDGCARERQTLEADQRQQNERHEMGQLECLAPRRGDEAGKRYHRRPYMQTVFHPGHGQRNRAGDEDRQAGGRISNRSIVSAIEHPDGREQSQHGNQRGGGCARVDEQRP